MVPDKKSFFPEGLLRSAGLNGFVMLISVVSVIWVSVLFSQHSVRERELVYRMKCVFTLDSADANLDFMGTSARPVSKIYLKEFIPQL